MVFRSTGQTYQGVVGVDNDTGSVGATGAFLGIYDNGGLTEGACLRIYNTADGEPYTANYERGIFGFQNQDNILHIGTEAGGTGAARAIRFSVNGTDSLDISTTGALSAPVSFTSPTITSSGVIAAANGTQALPAIIPSADTTSGIYFTGTGANCVISLSGGNFTVFDVSQNNGIRCYAKYTKYNNIATVSGGVPAEYATVDLTGQVAAIAATTLYTPTATAMFRISAYLKITTPGTSPVLGPVTITYTDGTDSVAQSAVMLMATEAGAAATSNSGNATSSKLIGSMTIFAKTGVAIQYAVALTGTVGSGAYEVHLKCEQM
jgi:hypothetical protein